MRESPSIVIAEIIQRSPGMIVRAMVEESGSGSVVIVGKRYPSSCRVSTSCSIYWLILGSEIGD
jgi:hypothetical protein